MIPALARFVEELRSEGVQVSPAELLDAGRAVARVGLEDRSRFRTALRATLAKDRAQRETLDRLFEAFFAPPSRAPGRKRGGKTGAGDAEGRRGRTGQRTDGPPSSRPLETNSRRRRRPTSTPPHAPRLVESVRRALERAGRGAPHRLGRLRRVKLRRHRPAESPDSPSTSGSRDPVLRDLTRPVPSREEREIAEQIPRLIEELRLRRSRRSARARRGQLWTRRLFRVNLATEGAPFHLPFRRRKRRASRVVLLVDVSFSAARAAGYFLWMASAFLRLGRQTRVVAFVDRPVDATRAVVNWMRGRDVGALHGGKQAADPGYGRRDRGDRRPGAGICPAGVSFADLLNSIPGLNLLAPSDYGRTLHALMSSRLRPAGRDTVLVILGDGRTNEFDPVAWSLEELARRCRAIVWLVCEPRQRWGTGDSALPHYLPFVDTIVEAWDPDGLARGVRELLRRL